MTIPLAVLKEKWMKDPAFKTEYDRLAPEFAIAAELIRARLRARLSQEELAERMGTSQSAIARLESGQTLPSHRLQSQTAPDCSITATHDKPTLSLLMHYGFRP
jgi:transcriptional regulator with XRE-family HTH domain